MQAFQRTIATASRYAAHLSAVILVVMVGLILLEIVLRSGFATSTFMLDEMVGYGVAAMAFLGLGNTLASGGLIRVNLLLARLEAGSYSRRLVELFCCVATLATMSLPIWFFGRSVVRKYQLGYTSGTIADVPAWIPESFVLVGMTLFWLQLLAYTLTVITGQADLDARRAVKFGGAE